MQDTRSIGVKRKTIKLRDIDQLVSYWNINLGNMEYGNLHSVICNFIGGLDDKITIEIKERRILKLLTTKHFVNNLSTKQKRDLLNSAAGGEFNINKNDSPFSIIYFAIICRLDKVVWKLNSMKLIDYDNSLTIEAFYLRDPLSISHYRSTKILENGVWRNLNGDDVTKNLFTSNNDMNNLPAMEKLKNLTAEKLKFNAAMTLRFILNNENFNNTFQITSSLYNLLLKGYYTSKPESDEKIASRVKNFTLDEKRTIYLAKQILDEINEDFKHIYNNNKRNHLPFLFGLLREYFYNSPQPLLVITYRNITNHFIDKFEKVCATNLKKFAHLTHEAMLTKNLAYPKNSFNISFKVYLILKGVDVNNGSTLNGGRCPLLKWAIEQNDFSMAYFAVVFGANVNSGRATSHLHDAINLNNIKITKFLLLSGASIEARDATGKKPLTLAIELDHALCCLAIINLNNSIKDLQDSLILACHKGHFETAKLLLSKDSTIINYQDENSGNTPLIYSIRSNKVRTTSLLINNPDIDLGFKDEQGKTYLHVAVEELDYQAVDLLLNKDIDSSAHDDNGFTALESAKKLLNSAKIDFQLNKKNSYVAKRMNTLTKIVKLIENHVVLPTINEPNQGFVSRLFTGDTSPLSRAY